MGTKWKELTDWPEGHRACRECGDILPFSEFHKHSLCYGGVNTVCRLCRRSRSRAAYHSRSYRQLVIDRLMSRSKRLGIPFNLELDDIVIPEVCPVLGTPMFKGGGDNAPSVDRINPNLGYVKGNIQIISNKANRIKSNATSDEVMLVALHMKRLEQGGSCEL